MKTTCTNGNARNGINGSRVRVWAELKSGYVLVDEMTIPKRNGVAYCEKYKGGAYGKWFDSACAEASKIESK